MCWGKESAGGSRFGIHTDSIKPGESNPFLCCMVAPRVVSLKRRLPEPASPGRAVHGVGRQRFCCATGSETLAQGQY